MLRFRISTLLVLVGLVCVASAFIAQRFEYAKRQAQVARVVLVGVNRPRTSDNEVLCSYEFDADGKWIKNAKPRWPDSLLDLFGKDFFYSIESLEVAGTHFDEETLLRIGRMSDLKTVLLFDSEITSDDLEHFQSLRKVEYLDLTMHKIGAGGLKHLSNVICLKHLDLGYPKNGLEDAITDVALQDLGKLQRLEHLGLMFNAITDAGVESIGKLKNLKTVVLNKTQVTQEGAKRLRQLLPNCKVHLSK